MRDNVHAGSLLRILGVAFGLAAVVGNIIGQGILRTPGIVAGAVPEPGLILLLWGLGGLYAMLGAVALVELGTSIPSAGGNYTFVRRAFGPLWGVLAGWSSWLQAISSIAALAVVVAEFLQRLGIGASLPVAILAPGIIALFWALNWSGTRISGRVQTLLSASKVLVLALLILVLLAFSGAPRAGAEAPGGMNAFALLLALRVIVSTYSGAGAAVYFSEEMQSPGRTIPRAVFGGIAAVTALYLLMNVALLHVLSPSQMAGSKLPAADALGIALGASGSKALTLFGILSVSAVIHLALMFTARFVFAMARDGVLPAPLARVAGSGTPRVALGVTALTAALLAASGGYLALLAVNVALGIANVLAGNLCALRLRAIEPDLPRPWRIPLYPWPVLLALAVNVALLLGLIWEDAWHSLAGFAVLAAIALIYKLSAAGAPRRG